MLIKVLKMGVQISEIVPRKQIEISDLKGKTIAIDAYNTLYQFLTTIRQQDGTPLMDSDKKITSHLSGLFYRNINLLQDGLKPVYVFDGTPPKLKTREIQTRTKAKKDAEQKYKKAEQAKDIEGMRKYSQQFVKITDEILEESKQLLEAMGIPCLQAEGEGEEAAAYLVNSGKVWAAASQDYDALLYGSKQLVRNLTLSRRRRTSTGEYVEVKPELITFSDVLNKLQLNHEQLICLGILVGTDFNPGGIKGIGQKTALNIAIKNKYAYEIFKYIKKSYKYFLDFNQQEIFQEFRKKDAKPISDKEIEKLQFNKLNKEKVKEILIKRDFSESRIDSGLQKLEKVEDEKKQKGLNQFI